MAKYIEIPGNKELRVHVCVCVYDTTCNTQADQPEKKPQQMLMSAF